MIFYFTSIGNSLYAAKKFDNDLHSIPQEMKKEKNLQSRTDWDRLSSVRI